MVFVLMEMGRISPSLTMKIRCMATTNSSNESRPSLSESASFLNERERNMMWTVAE